MKSVARMLRPRIAPSCPNSRNEIILRADGSDRETRQTWTLATGCEPQRLSERSRFFCGGKRYLVALPQTSMTALPTDFRVMRTTGCAKTAAAAKFCSNGNYKVLRSLSSPASTISRLTQRHIPIYSGGHRIVGALLTTGSSQTPLVGPRAF